MFTINDIAEATGGRIIGSDEGEVSGVSTDSRSVSAGELFVPLSGSSFDGHDYLASVANHGVRTALAAESWLRDHSLPGSLTCIAVDDTLLVGGLEAEAHLLGDPHADAQRQGALAADQVLERDALEELHRDVGRALPLAEIMRA